MTAFVVMALPSAVTDPTTSAVVVGSDFSLGWVPKKMEHCCSNAPASGDFSVFGEFLGSLVDMKWRRKLERLC